MSLSRDVLKWLQSLDLTFPVKNAKRDFSNGYTVAEIFACYFPQDIQMHSYDNATSVAKKIDNWEQLEKFFKKKNIVIDHQLVLDTIYCKGNAAVDMIDVVYTFLTNKKPVKRVAVVEEPNANLPAFARPTASQLIKDNISSADIVGKDASRLVANKAEKIMEKQKEMNKQERLQEIARKKAEMKALQQSAFSNPPTSSLDSLHISPRFNQLHPLPFPHAPLSPIGMTSKDQRAVSPTERALRSMMPSKDRAVSPTLRSSRGSTPIEKQKALRSAIARKGTVPVSNSPDLDIPEIEFKQVQVKTIPNDIAEKLRSRSAAPSRLSTPYLHQNGQSPDVDGKVHTMLPIVSEVVENRLANSDLLYSFDPKAELGLSFFESLSRLPADVISAVFVDLSAQTTKFCRSFFDDPKEMLYFFTLVAPIFTHTHNQPCIDAIIQTLQGIGEKMKSYDASTTWLLFERNVLPFLVSFVAQNPHRHRGITSVVFSFCPDDAESHVAAINKLRELAQNAATFVFCLLKLVQSETTSSIASLYRDEALKAMQNSDVSQIVHAAAISILTELIPFDYSVVLTDMEHVAEIGESSIWWEVKAQAVYLFCALLRVTEDYVHAQLCDAIGRVIASGGNIVLRILGGMALVPYLHTHPALYPLYIELLLSLSPNVLTSLLFDKEVLSTLIKGYGDSIGNYETNFIPSVWYGSEFLAYLIQELKATSTSKMGEQHLLLTLAATKSMPPDLEVVEPLELATWTQLFTDLMEYLCLAFCSDATCELAETVLKTFMLSMKQHTLQVFPTILSTLLILFPNISSNFGTFNSPKCQESVVRFLLDLYDESIRHNLLYFISNLENLVRNFPEYLVQTRLDVVIARVTGAQ